MAEFRVEKSSGYTVMSNHHLRNSCLSLKAKGLLSQMLSLPDNWDYTLAGLASINQEGKDAIRAAVRELEEAGYIERRQTRDENGKLAGNEYIIRETPVSPLSENPTTDNPSTEKPLTENPTEINKDKSNKDLLEKKSKKEKTKPPKLTRQEVEELLQKWLLSVSRGQDPELSDTLGRNLILFLDHRDAMGAPFTAVCGVTALCNKLLRLSGGNLAVAAEMLETAVERGWRSVYAPKGGASLSTSRTPQKRGMEYEEV